MLKEATCSSYRDTIPAPATPPGAQELASLVEFAYLIRRLPRGGGSSARDRSDSQMVGPEVVRPSSEEEP